MILCAAVMAITLAAPPRELRFAFPELRAHALEAPKVQYYSASLAQQLSLQGLRVTTAAEISTLLGFERQRQLLGCSADQSSCMAEIAAALGVDGIVTGMLGRFDDGIHVDLKIVANDGATLAVDSFESADEGALLREFKRSAERMADQLFTHFGVARPPKPGRGPPVASWVLAGVAAASAVAGGITGYQAYATSIERDRTPSGPGYEALHTNVQTQATIANVCYSVAAAGAIGAATVWILSGPGERQPTVSVGASAQGAMILLKGDW